MIVPVVSLREIMCAMVVVGCQGGGDDTDDTETAPVTEQGCAELEIAQDDGSCLRPGIAPDGCAAGFEHDGAYGCEPILPADTCPPGLMAVPGEAACRPVMACGEGQWGDIPVDATTVYVDESYGGTDSDGSAVKPWTTIGEAVSAAPTGALIAVAAGSYAEDVLVTNKSLRLWGVCPERVEIVGMGTLFAAIDIIHNASGTEVHGLAIRGASRGLGLSGSVDVLVDRVWVHDTGLGGIDLSGAYGPTAAIVRGSLVEATHVAGIFLSGADGTVETSVVRGTLPHLGTQAFGEGIAIQVPCPEGPCLVDERPIATVRGSLIEHNTDIGLSIKGADVTVEATVVRGTLPDATQQATGRGINIQPVCDAATCDPATRANVTIRGSVVAQNHDIGIFIGGSDVIMDATVVRDTWPRAADGNFGDGVVVMSAYVLDGEPPPASATLTNMAIARSARAGLSSFGGDLSLAGTAITCAAFGLDGEVIDGDDFVIEDRGNNACGCPNADGQCTAVSAGLAPPTPL
jgi:hypothetical protein